MNYSSMPHTTAMRASLASMSQWMPSRLRQPEFLMFSAVAVVLGGFTVAALSSRHAALLILAGLAPFVAIVIGQLRKLLLAIIILDIPLGIDIHLGFRSEMAGLGALGGYNLSVSLICLALLYALWLGEFVCRKGPRVSPRLRESLPLILYVAALLISTLIATDAALSAFQVFLYLQMLLLFVYVASTVRTREDVLFIGATLVLGLIIESLVMIYVRGTGQHIALGPISTAVEESFIGSGRMGGTLGSPNTAAGYLVMLTLFTSSFLFTRLRAFYKLVAACAFGVGSVALLITGSRGGWASFVISLLVLWFLAWRGGWLSLQSSFAVVIVTVLLSAVFHEAILNRLVSDDHGAAYSRVPLMRLAFEMIKEHPILGVGPNNFAAVMDSYMTADIRKAWMYTVHNKYLLIWSETGFFGMAAFLWFLAATLRAAWHCSYSRDPLIGPLAFGLTAALLAHDAHMLVDVFNDRPMVQLLCFVGALVVAIYAMQRQGARRYHESRVRFI